mgnify:CR=1 FL=1
MKRIVLAVMLAILTHLSAAQERIVLRMDDFVKVYIDYLNNNYLYYQASHLSHFRLNDLNKKLIPSNPL